MSDVASVAAFSAATAQSQVDTEISIKMLKLINERQKSVATLIDSAVEAAAQIASGEGLDVRA